MRAFVTFVAGLATTAILATLGIVALQNPQGEQITFLGTTLAGTVGLDVATGAAMGFVAALFLLLPGQVASALYTKTQGYKLRALEGHDAKLRGQLKTLRLDHIRLQDDYRCLRDEAERLRSAVAQLAGPSTAAALAAAPGRPAKDVKERAAADAATVGAKEAPIRSYDGTGAGGNADVARGGGSAAGGNAFPNGGATGARGWWARLKAKIRALFSDESAERGDEQARGAVWRGKGEPWQA